MLEARLWQKQGDSPALNDLGWVSFVAQGKGFLPCSLSPLYEEILLAHNSFIQLFIHLFFYSFTLQMHPELLLLKTLLLNKG